MNMINKDSEVAHTGHSHYKRLYVQNEQTELLS